MNPISCKSAFSRVFLSEVKQLHLGSAALIAVSGLPLFPLLALSEIMNRARPRILCLIQFRLFVDEVGEK